MNENPNQLYRLLELEQDQPAPDGCKTFFNGYCSTLRTAAIPVTADPWIAYSERKPTKEDFDANPNSFVQAVRNNGHCFYIYSDNNVSHGDIIAWRRVTPPVPPKPKSVTLRYAGRDSTVDAEPLPDGRIKLSCGDVLLRADVDALIALRKEKMEKEL